MSTQHEKLVHPCGAIEFEQRIHRFSGRMQNKACPGQSELRCTGGAGHRTLGIHWIKWNWMQQQCAATLGRPSPIQDARGMTRWQQRGQLVMSEERENRSSKGNRVAAKERAIRSSLL